jgi:hypothetical protein
MNKPTELDILSIKAELFKMWIRVERGQFDSRSFVGDAALQLRAALYDDDKQFFEALDKWKGFNNYK